MFLSRNTAKCSYGLVFFFQAEDGIRDPLVTGVQRCALPISASLAPRRRPPQPRPAFAPRAKVNGAYPRPTNPPANAAPATAIPNNKSTRTSKPHTPPGFHATPPAPAPTTFPASTQFRIRCAPRAPPPRAENQSACRAQKIKSVATTKPARPPQKM